MLIQPKDTLLDTHEYPTHILCPKIETIRGVMRYYIDDGVHEESNRIFKREVNRRENNKLLLLL